MPTSLLQQLKIRIGDTIPVLPLQARYSSGSDLPISCQSTML